MSVFLHGNPLKNDGPAYIKLLKTQETDSLVLHFMSLKG